MSAYIVLKFSNKYSLLLFSYFMCAYIIVLNFNNTIYIENTNKRIKFTFIYLWLLWSSTINGTP